METPTIAKILANILFDFVGSILLLALGIALVQGAASVVVSGNPWLIAGFIFLACLLLSWLMAVIFKR